MDGLCDKVWLSELPARFNEADLESDLFLAPGGRPRGLEVVVVELKKKKNTVKETNQALKMTAKRMHKTPLFSEACRTIWKRRFVVGSFPLHKLSKQLHWILKALQI